MKELSISLPIIFLLALNGCAPTSQIATGSASDLRNEQLEQVSTALTLMRDRSERLDSLYWPIRSLNTDLCAEDVTYISGFGMNLLSAFPRQYKEAANIKLGITENISIYTITRDSPAEKAGLQRGDVITSFNGEAIGAGNRGATKMNNLLKKNEEATYKLGIRRDLTETNIDITPEAACSFPVLLDPSDAINAYADGTNIYITTGMYRFAQSDQELQLVIAHELAHNSEGHLDKKLGNTILGAVLDVTAAAYGINTQGAFSDATSRMFSQEFEREADYVAMYMLSKASVPTIEAANFWRRMSAEYPGSIKGSFSASHPASAERYLNIEATDLEIRNKINSGSALMPERK